MPSKKTPQSDAVLRLTHANAHFARGAARAATVGIENFVNKLQHENVLSPDLTQNGFVAGAVAGWAAAMFEGAKLFEDFFLKWLGGAEEAPFTAETFKRARNNKTS